MRSLSTAHFVHNKFPFFFNNMFVINISVVRPTSKGKEDYLADLARNKGTEVQKPRVVDSKFIRRRLNESVMWYILRAQSWFVKIRV